MTYKTWITLLLTLAVGLAGLAGCDRNTCFTAAKLECQTCEQDGPAQKTYCTCIEDGKLEKSSANLEFETDDQAAIWCDMVLKDLHKSGTDNGAWCRQEQAMLNKWGEDWCEGVEFGTGGDDDDTYYYYYYYD